MTLKLTVLVYLACLPFALLALAAGIAALARVVDAAPSVVRRTAHRVRAVVRAALLVGVVATSVRRADPVRAVYLAAHRVRDAWRSVRVTIDVETRIVAMALARRARRWRADRDHRRAPVGRRLYVGGALDGPVRW